MPIGPLFHLMQIVEDFDAASERYDRLFSPQIFAPKHWSDFDARWASLGVIGPDFVLELMEPGKEEAHAGKALPKFFRRHGSHLHSFAWFVDADDIVNLALRLRDAGVRVLDPYGALEGKDTEGRPITFFTFPKDTFGQLEFQALGPGMNTMNDPHLEPGWTGAYWRDEHPLGLLRTSHLTTVVSDVNRARDFYEKLLDSPAFHEEETPERRSVFVFVGTETVVELAEPKDPGSRLGRDLAEHGELPHAIVMRVRDLDAAARHASDSGFRIVERTDDTVTLDPDQLFGALIAFTVRDLPNDPRG